MKRLFALFLCFALLLLLPFPVVADQTASIIDNEDLLTTDEEEHLAGLAWDITQEYGIRVVIVTVDSLDGESVETYADDYYDRNYGSYDSGVLLLLAMDTREWAVSTCGDAMYALTDYGIQSLFSSISGYLAEDDYYRAFTIYLDELENYFRAFEGGEPIDGYHGGYDGPGTYVPGTRGDVIYYDREPGLGDYLRVLFVSLLIGAAAGGIGLLVLRGQMNTAKAQSGAASYLRDGSYNLTRRMDIFLYSRVNRTRRAQSSNGGGGGGSRVHRSSGGRSHGGGHGRF